METLSGRSLENKVIILYSPDVGEWRRIEMVLKTSARYLTHLNLQSGKRASVKSKNRNEVWEDQFEEQVCGNSESRCRL
jgi:hypothetical protein